VSMARKYGAVAMFMIFLIMMIPIVHASELNLVYDANGNVVEMGDGLHREYNGLNQLVRIRNITNNNLVQEFVHDPVEERIVIKKTFAGGVLQETVYYFDKEYVRVVNTTGTYNLEYVYHEGQLIGQVNSDGTKLYVHGDLEGSTSVITNSSGNIVENTTYSPFGEILTGGSVSRFDSEGKEFDSVVGDYDFNFRKFCVQLGIFCQPDTLIPNVYDPQSLNRYMFERGNPYKNVDPTGHASDSHTVGPDPFGMVESAGELLSYNIGYAVLISRADDESLKSTLRNHRNEANKAIVRNFVSAAFGGVPLTEDASPEGEIFAGSGLYVEYDPDCKSICFKKTDLTKFESTYEKTYQADKSLVQSQSSKASNIILQRVIQKSLGESLSQKQVNTVKSGGSTKTKSGSTITSVTLNGQTVYVKLTPVKETKKSKK